MLQTTTGEPVEVIDAGLPNTNAGPDFFNAKLKIGGTLWVGNIEVHTLASDWMRHGHDKDAAYDNVILHVAETVDCEVFRANGIPVPQLQLSCPESVRQRYDELSHAEIYLPNDYCIVPTGRQSHGLSARNVPPAKQKARNGLLVSEEKTIWNNKEDRFPHGSVHHNAAARLERCNNHWEDVFFITLARNFGFGLNGDAFEAWASRLPFR